MEKKRNNRFLIYALFLSVFIFVIVLIRAATTEVTWDEAFTYVNYVRKFDFSRQFIEVYKNFANNHILNTLLILLFDNICNIPYNELIIRLPNIIMFIFYLIGCFLFSRNNKHKYLLFTGLAANYYVTEFFGLARGYGLATGFIIWMLYFVKKAADNDYNDKNILISCLFGILACYANTVSIFALGSIGLLYFIQLYKRKRIFDFLKHNILPIILSVILFVYIVLFHFLVTGNGKPLFGEATLIEFLSRSFMWMFIQNRIINIISSVIILAVIIISAIVFRKKLIEKPFFSALILFLLFLISVPIVLNKPFLIERCLIPFWPLVYIGLIENYELIETKIPQLINKVLALVIILLLLLSFGVKINLKQTRDWYNNYRVRSAMYKALYEKRRFKQSEKDDYCQYYGCVFYKEKILNEYDFKVILDDV